MIAEFVKCISSIGIIALSGCAIYVWILRRAERRHMDIVAYGWGAGIVVLYIVGGLLVRIRPLSFRWQYYCLAIAAALIATIAFIRPPRWQNLPAASKGTRTRDGLDAWSVLMLGVIRPHACILLWINLNHLIFDSDAADSNRWIGLAKEIYRVGGLEASTRVRSPLFPSLIPLMANALTWRWFDSLAALPWFLSYCFQIVILGGVLLFFFCATGNVRFTLNGTNTSRLLMHWLPLSGLLLAMWHGDEKPAGFHGMPQPIQRAKDY